MTSPIKLLRVKEVLSRIGISRATLYRWLEQDQSFPRPVSLGANSICFVEDEINNWIAGRVRASRAEMAA